MRSFIVRPFVSYLSIFNDIKKVINWRKSLINSDTHFFHQQEYIDDDEEDNDTDLEDDYEYE